MPRVRPAPKKPKPQARGAARRPPADPGEMFQRKATIARLLGSGMTRSQIRDAMETQHGMNASQTDYAIDLVNRDIVRDYEADRRDAKALQVNRLRRLLAQCQRDMNDSYTPDGVLISAVQPADRQRAIANAVRIEAQLAKVLGTYAPIRVEADVDVTLRQSLLAVVSTLSPEERDRMVAEQVALEVAAAQAQVHGLPTSVEDRSSVAPKNGANGSNGRHS